MGNAGGAALADRVMDGDDAGDLAIEARLLADPALRAFLHRRDTAAQRIALAEFRALASEIRRATRRRTVRADPVQILWRELCDMRHCIEQTQSEIAALRPGPGGTSSIISATSEIDAIVSSIERATNDILHQAETIQAASSSLATLPEAASAGREIGGAAVQIMLACSFQDLTGQRMAKIVSTLRYLERRVNAMIEIWGPNDAAPAQDQEGDVRPDAHLLNGPTDGALGQDDVDALFAD